MLCLSRRHFDRPRDHSRLEMGNELVGAAVSVSYEVYNLERPHGFHRNRDSPCTTEEGNDNDP